MFWSGQRKEASNRGLNSSKHGSGAQVEGLEPNERRTLQYRWRKVPYFDTWSVQSRLFEFNRQYLTRVNSEIKTRKKGGRRTREQTEAFAAFHLPSVAATRRRAENAPVVGKKRHCRFTGAPLAGKRRHPPAHHPTPFSKVASGSLRGGSDGGGGNVDNDCTLGRILKLRNSWKSQLEAWQLARLPTGAHAQTSLRFAF